MYMIDVKLYIHTYTYIHAYRERQGQRFKKTEIERGRESLETS